MDLLKLIAKSADVCLKPWIHAVVPIDPSAPAVLDELNVRIECRDPQGERCPERDLELEIYRSCLLYTSPSPRDQRGSRMPSSA